MRLEIELKRPPIFYPGQRVTGVVNIIMQIPGIVRILRLQVIGREQTSWYHVNAVTKEDGDDLASFTEHIFLKDEQYCIGGKYNEADHEVGVGVTTIYFDYKLPKSLPTSYKGIHGRVEYKVEAHAQTNWGMKDHKVLFDVKGIFNLAQLSQTLQIFSPKAQSREIETITLLCKPNGNVEVFLYLQKAAYAPGEKIPFFSRITNNSRFTAKDVQINLVRYVTYIIRGSPKQEAGISIFTLRKGDPVKRGREEIFENNSNSFRVPKDCIPNNLGRKDGVGLISIKYKVEISLKVSSHFQNSLLLAIPIYIGGVSKRIVPEKKDSIEFIKSQIDIIGSEILINSKAASRIGSMASSMSKVFKRNKPPRRKKSEGELTSQDKIFPFSKSSIMESKTNKSYDTTSTVLTNDATETQDKITTKSDNESDKITPRSDNESDKITTSSSSEKSSKITINLDNEHDNITIEDVNEPDKIAISSSSENEPDTTTNLDNESDKIPNNSESDE